MKAEIIAFDDTGKGKLVETWSLDGDEAICSDPDSQAYMEEFGIAKTAKSRLFPKDGRAFIQGLLKEFSGKRIRARLVSDDA
jgi:hypothetical protein